MRKIEKPVEIEQGDSFKVILSKYGALGLDKQENLSDRKSTRLNSSH